jgi:hypothetical protein
VAHIPIHRNWMPQVSISRPGITNLRPKFGHESKCRFVSNRRGLSEPVKQDPLLREDYRYLVPYPVAVPRRNRAANGWIGTSRPRYIRNMNELPKFGSKNSLPWLRQATEPTSQLRMT